MTCNTGGATAAMGGGPNAMGCTYAPSNTSIAGAEVNVVGGYETRFVSVVEFVMGDGAMPSGEQVYDAAATAGRIRASLAQE
jgi:hypothetical protein